MTSLFADTADLAAARRLAPSVAGFTSNATLMRRAGVEDFREFALTLISVAPDLPVSLGVLADDPAEIAQQARVIAGWGENVYVKVPVVNSHGESLMGVIADLAREVRVNVTAVFTPEQALAAGRALAGGRPGFVSVFAGRIADAGHDPESAVRQAVGTVEAVAPESRVIWASTRQAFDIRRAQRCSCHAITVAPELIAKHRARHRTLDEWTLDTARMFHRDAIGYSV